jgi:hypothetical protein
VAPEFAVLTWLFQVMPLFFAVGGFASAMSLDAHRRRAGTDGDWVVQRLRRLVAPTVVLSGTWLILLAGGTALGAGGLVAAGAVGAAIPLWLLANYTIDTALAPTISPRCAATTPCSAIMLVAFCPWPAAMIHVSGIAFSPTHPPSVALVVFGAAQVATAVALAPRVTGILARNRRAWTTVVAANAVSMSVYLWHLTAAVGASAILYAAGALPTAEIGSIGWWIEKLPMIGLALVLLVPIVAVVGRFERTALLAERVPWTGTAPHALALALVVSASLKVWSLGNAGSVAAGAAGIVFARVLLRRGRVVRPTT